MKTTRQHIDEIVREELRRVLHELNPGHDKLGRFASRDDAVTYSLSDRAVRDNKIDPRYAMRGRIASGGYNPEDPKGSVKEVPGANSGPKTAGRQKQTGEPIPPKYSLSQHDKRYSALQEVIAELDTLEANEGFVSVPASLLDRMIQSLMPYLAGETFPEEPMPL